LKQSPDAGGRQRSGVGVLECTEQALFLIRVDEVDVLTLFVHPQLPNQSQSLVDGIEDRAVLLGDSLSESLCHRLVQGRPWKCNRSLWLVRGIVINTNGYVTRAATGSPMEGVCSRTVRTIRPPWSRIETTRSV
jgi:hypothetical protein